MSKPLTIVHLYPVEMNIYGDTGNVLVLQKRLEWRGVKADVVSVEIGQPIPVDADIIISGGGQDTGQSRVEKDLLARKKELKAMADDGVSMLMVCGTYQLFGHKFVTHQNQTIQGIGVLDVETHAGNERHIGNIVTQSSEYGELVGYENHSGLTYLGEGALPFAEVVSGTGNNESDMFEGARYNNVIGTYLHGPILPKNPQLADALLMQALERKYGNNTLKPLDDYIEHAAHQVAIGRSR